MAALTYGAALAAEDAVERALRGIRAGMPYGTHPAEAGLVTALLIMQEARHAAGSIVGAERDEVLAEALPAILRRWTEVIHIEGGKK